MPTRRRRPKAILVLMTVVFAWVLASAPAVSAATKTANVTLPVTTKTTHTMSGNVKRQGTLANVAGVYVYASAFSFPGGPITSGSTTTNATGNWTITGLVSGTYRVGYSPPTSTNLLSSYWNSTAPNNNTLAYSSATAVTVGTTNKTGVNTRLRVGQKISGKVTKTDGTTPIAGVQVSAGSGSAETNASGNYTIQALPPGTYTLQVFPDSEQPYQGGCYWTGATLFKFSANCANKTSLVVGPDKTGINIRLPGAFMITGFLKNRSNVPIANAAVSASQQTPTTWGDDSSAETDATGKFVIRGLNPGSYQLFESAPFGTMYLDGFYLATDTTNRFTLFDSSASNVAVSANVTLPGAIRPPTGVSLSGKVTTTAGAGLQYAGVYIYSASLGYLGSTSTDGSGNWTVKPLPININLEIDVSPPFDRDDLMSGFYNSTAPNYFTPYDASKTLIKLTGNRSGLLTRLPVGNVINGKITKTGGAAVPEGTFVYAYDNGHRTSSYAFTAANGTYSIKGLPNGNYVVSISGDQTLVGSTLTIIASGYYASTPTTTHYTANPASATTINFP